MTEQNKQQKLKRQGDIENRKLLDEVENMILDLNKSREDYRLVVDDKESKIRTVEYEKQMTAIQPRLIEAMITLGGVQTTEILAQNLKEQGGNLSSIFSKGGFDGFLEAIEGTPLHDNVMGVFKDYKDLAKKK